MGVIRQNGMRWGSAAALVLTPAVAIAQQAPGTPPPPGWTLGVSVGGGWDSNPAELSTRAKGDAVIAQEITLSRRWALWEGGAFTVTAQGASAFYARSHQENFNRALLTAAFSQSWQGFNVSLSAIQRKTMNGDLSAHDGASREAALALGRTFTLHEALTLGLFLRGARRFLEDGTEDQWRASGNATLAYRQGPWIFRLGGGYSWILEDKTIFLPRINTRTINARAAIAYEWAPDSEVSLRVSFSRSYSSYQPDRTKNYTFGPQIGTQWRF
jgi:hypothetical protein